LPQAPTAAQRANDNVLDPEAYRTVEDPVTSHEPRAVLWDMDGTLLASAEFHWLSWQEALAAEGRAMSRAQFDATFGRRNASILRDLFGADFPDAAVARIAAAKEERYRALARAGGVEPLPGVREWLARLRAGGWRHAVASSAPHLNITAILEALGLAPAFDAVVGDEDVRVGKPDPEVYLTAAARLGVPPARCVVVEDAAAGIEGAHRAGMRAIGVGPRHADLGADLATPSLDLLPADAFDRLVGEAPAS
jgi:beta-phosphoglucomutase